MPALLGTLHAAEHSLIALLPLWAMCDRWDIGGLSTNVHFQTGSPTIFVYDGHAGGVGLTERGFERFEGWVATPPDAGGLPVPGGCPSCVQSPKCGNLNEPLDKAGATVAPRADARPRRLSGAEVSISGTPIVVMLESNSSGRRKRAVHGIDLLRRGAPGTRSTTRSATEIYGRYRELCGQTRGRGRDAGRRPAGLDADATTVRVREAQALVLDGPYAETKETLGGYFLFECASIDEAVDWAARIPAAEHGASRFGRVYVDPVRA